MTKRDASQSSRNSSPSKSNAAPSALSVSPFAPSTNRVLEPRVAFDGAIAATLAHAEAAVPAAADAGHHDPVAADPHVVSHDLADLLAKIGPVAAGQPPSATIVFIDSAVSDPAIVKSRVELRNCEPVYLLIHARRDVICDGSDCCPVSSPRNRPAFRPPRTLCWWMKYSRKCGRRSKRCR